jgi:hypothetical protein
MGTRKATEQQVRNLTSNSTGTYSISLPKTLIQELRWQRGQRLVVSKQGKKLIIHDWQA